MTWLSLDYFDKVYKGSNKYPDSIFSILSEEVITKVKLGTGSLLAELEIALPNTFNMLTKECSDLLLLEVIEYDIPGDESTKFSNFFFGVENTHKRLIIFNIENKNRSSDVKKKYFDSIPDEFQGFYNGIDGMSIPDNQGPGIVDIDLPASLASWRQLDYFFSIHKFKKKDLNKIMENFKGSDLRVILQGRQGSVLLTDMASRKKEIYLIETKENFNPIKLENPVGIVDIYCSNAISGKELKMSELL